MVDTRLLKVKDFVNVRARVKDVIEHTIAIEIIHSSTGKISGRIWRDSILSVEPRPFKVGDQARTDAALFSESKTGIVIGKIIAIFEDMAWIRPMVISDEIKGWVKYTDDVYPRSIPLSNLTPFDVEISEVKVNDIVSLKASVENIDGISVDIDVLGALNPGKIRGRILRQDVISIDPRGLNVGDRVVAQNGAAGIILAIFENLAWVKPDSDVPPRNIAISSLTFEPPNA